MKLNYKKIGNGKPLIILHGLFGLLDNWQSLGKLYAENGFEVYLVDQRNHGHSPHSSEWNYQVMSNDLMELIDDNGISKVNIIGHSMGGKTAMYFAKQQPPYIEKLIVVDIAPRFYPIHHDTIIKALETLPLETIKTRKEAETLLRKSITDEGTLQFLLKNMYWTGDGEQARLNWRFNLPVISANIEQVGEPTPSTSQEYISIVKTIPTLFIRGEKSNYIQQKDEVDIYTHFPNSSLTTITDAGHWVHAEKPKDFFETTLTFLKK